jgi:hypothetical protein
VHVVSAGDEKTQKIPDEDFAKVLGIWDAYANRKLPLAKVQEHTQYSTHVVSILHALEKA